MSDLKPTAVNGDARAIDGLGGSTVVGFSAAREETSADPANAGAERSENAEVLEELGVVLAKNKRMDEAMPYLRAAYRQGPLSDDTLMLMVKACYALKEADEARVYLRVLLERDPDNIDALKYSARVANSKKEWSVALEAWMRIADLRPQDFEPLYQMMRSRERMHDWDETIALADKVLEVDPENADAVRGVARAGIETGRIDLAERAIAQLAELDLAEAIKMAERAIKRDMVTVAARAISAARAVGGDGEAAADAQAVEWAEQWVGAAMRNEMEERLEQATALYRAARMIAPEFDAASRGIDRIRKPFLAALREAYRDKRFDRAVECARKTIAIDPETSEAYLTGGRALMNLDDPQGAFELLREGAKLEPESAWMQLNFGRAAEKVDDHRLAHEAYSRVLSLPASPGEHARYSAEAKKKLEQITRNVARSARRLYKEEDYEGARELLCFVRESGQAAPELEGLTQSVVKRCEKKVRALYHEKSDATVREAEKLLRLDPTNAYALKVAGRQLVASRLYHKAALYWDRLAKHTPEQVEPWLQLARCYAKLDRDEYAATAARRVLDLEPEHAEATKILNRAAI